MLAALVATGWIGGIYDALLLMSLVCAAVLIWSSRDWKAWALVAVMVTAGLGWSSFDQSGCSAWWTGRIVYGKLSGHLPYLEWNHFLRAVFARCSGPNPGVAGTIRLLREKRVEGRKWELYESELGKFWLTGPGKGLLTWLVWEMSVEGVYESGEVVVRPGDTVIDCGAHVGVFSRYALRRGAGRVIAIEPAPGNLACLETNLAEEISAGRVSVVRAGVWNEQTQLTFFHFDKNPAQDSFFRKSSNGTKLERVQVFPLDEIVEQLGLERVDFIKMDIEGSERLALRGARRTIARFKPRMAICSYHFDDDAKVIPAIVKGIEPSYQIHAKDLATNVGFIRTKVLFFHY